MKNFQKSNCYKVYLKFGSFGKIPYLYGKVLRYENKI